MKPLAYRMRPNQFEDVYGQDHLIGEQGVLSAMILKQKPMSFILYGPPGTGKTTIAMLFAQKCGLEFFLFNASTESKSRLKDIIETTNFADILLIIDEIHRMKTDVQDYLLPFMENGKVIVVGLTTLNPYQSINQAIRSRCHLFEVKKVSDDDIKKILLKARHELEVDIQIEQNALDAITRYANHEVRSALNLLESASLVLEDGDTLTANLVYRIAGASQKDLDFKEDQYYVLLSALQKSIRGSDVDASIHYLAQLITLGDLNTIIRRLIVIAYEDIGLANPTMGQKVLTATEASLMVGLPEARIILANIVIDMAISPKSNSAYLAIDQALADFNSKDIGKIPDYLDNQKIKLNPSIYHYPHHSEQAINDQSYLPDKIRDVTYYQPKQTSSYEKALADRLLLIDKVKYKKR